MVDDWKSAGRYLTIGVAHFADYSIAMLVDFSRRVRGQPLPRGRHFDLAGFIDDQKTGELGDSNYLLIDINRFQGL